MSFGKLNMIQPTTLPADLPLADLKVIDAGLLFEGGHPEESAKLLDACRTDGFFFLDVRGVEALNISQTIEDMYKLEQEFYDLPDDTKLSWDIDNLSKLKLNGYKPVGRNWGGIGGKKDGFETMAIPKDGVMGLSKYSQPPVVHKYMETLQTFSTLVGYAAQAIFSSLSSSLEIPRGEGFEDHHRSYMPTPDVIRLLKYHAQPMEERGQSHTPHTDLGSLTFLFTKQPGLQVLRSDDKWAWVEPREGHAIVNLGDGMKLLSNGYLHSCLHRVGPLPGMAMSERYSFAYLLRAEDETPMTGLKSPYFPSAPSDQAIFSSGEWIQRKFGMLRGNTKKTLQDDVIMGGRKVADA